MSFLGSILGLGGTSSNGNINHSSNTGSSISGAETIERLCDRLQSASLLEDRRESLKTIKSLSTKYKLEVGTQAMLVLIDVLDKNRLDSEMCCLALDSLYNVMASIQDENKDLPNDLNIQFTEMFIKTSTNVNLIFDLLDEFEFQTRWSTLKLLNALVINQTQQLQDIILQIPRGVSRLMDLLNDSREVIRNDTILLLNNLTKTNTNIQKIIAFESGFDRIMEIIEGEGSAADGGIIVEDCFNLLLNLLKMNYSNQNYFKEANYIKTLCKYLDLSGSNNGTNLASDLGDPNNSGAWTAQKTTNLSLLLKLIRCLVSPTNQQVIINDCQRAFNRGAMLHRLCAMIMMPGIPADLLSEAIGTVGEVIRGNEANQQMFSAVQMQTSPINVILLMSMVNEKQPFHLRCSILYCFECFLYRNEKAKSDIVETLLPNQTTTNDQVNSGQILCSGLFNQHDFISNWLCAVAMSHTINENNQLKEHLLRVQFANVNSNQNSQPVSLMQQCMLILIESTSAISADQSSATSANSTSQTTQNRNKLQTTVAMLMFLSTWLSNCPMAVNYFLAHPQNIPYLISQVSSTDTEDKSLIIQGLTAFLLGLCMLYNSNQIESYTIAQLKDIIKKRCGIEQFEDKLEFISQHELYTKTLRMPTFSIKCKNSSDLLFDYEFTRLFKSNETLILNMLQNKNQNIQSSLIGSTTSATIEQQNSLIISQYQQIIREQDAKIREHQQEKLQLAQTCAQLQEYCQSLQSSLNTKDEYLKERSQELDAFSSDKLKMHARINELEVKNNLLEEKCSEQEDELCKLQREKGVCQETINNLNQYDSNIETIELKSQNKQLKSQLTNLNTEQENLLTLLQEMELKLKTYKNALKERGYNQLSDSDDDDEDENDKDKTDDAEPKQEDVFETQYDEHSHINQIIQSKQMSNSNSSNSVGLVDQTNSSISSTSSSNNSDVHNVINNKSTVLMNYPPQTGQNIVNAVNSNNSVDPFFQNHPFFSQQQKQEQNSLQNYFK